MLRFFEFSDGRNIVIETDTYEEAVKTVKEYWWDKIFEERDFRVVKVKNSSIKRD